jgi:hypothetical protein
MKYTFRHRHVCMNSIESKIVLAKVWKLTDFCRIKMIDVNTFKSSLEVNVTVFNKESLCQGKRRCFPRLSYLVRNHRLRTCVQHMLCLRFPL